MTAPDAMQLLAANQTTSLLYDAGETQGFFLYDKSTKTLTSVSATDAKAFFQGGPAAWQLPGACYFGKTVQNNLSIWYPQLQSPQGPTVLVSEVDAIVLESEDGTILIKE